MKRFIGPCIVCTHQHADGERCLYCGGGRAVMVDGVHTWALDQCLCVGTANPPVCIPCGHAHVSGVQCNMPTQTPEVDGTHGTVITVSFCTCAGHGDGRFRYCGIGMKP